MNMLEPQRLLLRHPVLEDLNDWFAFYSDPDAVQYIQMELKRKSEPIGVYVFQAAQHRRI
jgi:RimJ/RimL family protein N-acetyltransferase